MASPPRPLCITDDPDLIEELLGLAAESGLEVEVTADPSAVRRAYSRAPLVVIGDGSSGVCVEAKLPVRDDVLLVTQQNTGERMRVVARLLGAERLVLPRDNAALRGRFTRMAERLAAHAGQLIAVLGGRGGAGASVLAAGLAVTIARAGRRALLIDADPLGGGVDLVVGWEARDGLRFPVLPDPAEPPAEPGGRERLAVLSSAGLTGLSPEAMSVAIDDGRATRDLVVTDLPRRLDEAAAVALRAADRAFLLVPSELRACAAAARVAEAASLHTGALELIVRGPGPGRIRTREIARALDLPVAGTLRYEPGLSRAIERGVAPAGSGRGPLAALCQRLLGDLIEVAA
jgi:secretion/DNA translocation related CpaE-like protein